MQPVRLRVSAGILAGGRSRRMGRQKLELPVRESDHSLLDYAVERMSGFAEILIASSPDQAPAWRRRYPGCRILEDQEKDFGPLEGMRRILMEAENDRVLILAADMPEASRELLEKIGGLEGWEEEYDCLLTRSAGRKQQLCGVYTKKCLPHLEEMRQAGLHAVHALLERLRVSYVDPEQFGFSGQSLFDVDTPEDYRNYLDRRS